MRNKYFRYGWLLSAAVLLAACSNEDDITPDVPDTPSEGYRWTFGGGVGIDDDATTRAGHWEEKGEADANGYNKLTFAWNYGTTDEMVFAFADVTGHIIMLKLDQYYAYMDVKEHTEKGDNYAIFETTQTFDKSQSELKDHTLYAVTPILTSKNGSKVETANSDFVSVTLPLPDNFTQTTDKNPDFLHQYMYMTATAMLDGNGNVEDENGLHFEHIPATFRFKVTNKSGKDITLNNIKVSATNANGESINLAPKELTLITSYESELWEKQTVSEFHKEITTTTDATMSYGSTDNTYTAYALLFPGVEFADTDNITITAVIDGTEQSVLAITGEQLKAVTTSSKLLSGNLYTFNLKYEVGLTITGVTVEGWNDGGTIDAPTATEPEASYSISGTSATITVPEYASAASVQAAAQAALAEDYIFSVVVNGALTEAQQNALAKGLAGAEYLVEVTLTDVPLASITPAVAALYSTVACDDFEKVVSSDGYSIVQGGSVGDNATYTLYYGNSSQSMTLNIDGTGAMNDFEDYTPWSDYKRYITTVNIADDITSIGQIAFYECVITSVTIPKSVNNINDRAFEDCSQLMTVICESETPPTLGANVFNNCSDNLIIYVPAESVDTYKSEWSAYDDKIHPIQ